jgi:hypothetical protein
MTSRLEQLKNFGGTLNEIAFLVGTNDPLGPSSDLVALLCTSRTLYTALSPQRNKLLYKRIFEHKFDTAAHSRRLGPRWCEPKCYLAELRKRYLALRQIRQHRLGVDGQEIIDVLWTA